MRTPRITDRFWQLEILASNVFYDAWSKHLFAIILPPMFHVVTVCRTQAEVQVWGSLLEERTWLEIDRTELEKATYQPVLWRPPEGYHWQHRRLRQSLRYFCIFPAHIWMKGAFNLYCHQMCCRQSKHQGGYVSPRTHPVYLMIYTPPDNTNAIQPGYTYIWGNTGLWLRQEIPCLVLEKFAVTSDWTVRSGNTMRACRVA